MAKPEKSAPKSEATDKAAPTSEPSPPDPTETAQDAKSASAAAGSESAPKSEAPMAKPARFRVWPHGTLAHDGIVFAAGAELPLTEAEVEQLRCPAIERF